MDFKISNNGLFSPIAGESRLPSVKNAASKQAAAKINEYFQDLKTKETPTDENEPRLTKDNGQLNDLIGKLNAVKERLKSPEVQSKRTWTTDANGNYNDCPEVIECRNLENQMSEYVNKKLGAPQKEGQEVMFESGGYTYCSKACLKGDKTLFWMTFCRPINK